MTGIFPFGAGFGLGAVKGLGVGVCPKLAWQKIRNEKTNE
jgi:hypothetical protein